MVEPILITGPPRSGTSATAGIFHAAGAFGGSMRGANRYNPKGQFENKSLVNINKGWLARNGWDHFGQRPVPGPVIGPCDWPSIHEVELLRVETWNTLYSQGWDGRSPWFFKDPKLVWNWPLWMSTFPNAQWVLVERDIDDNALSCQKTGFMKAYKSVESWKNWIRTHYERMAQLCDHTDNVCKIRPVRFIVENEHTGIKKAIEQCGLTWHNRKVAEFIDRRFWHGKNDRNIDAGNS